MAQNALMQRPWNFEVANVGNFTQPVMQGIEAGYRDRQQGVENERQNKLMGFQEQRLVMEKAKATRDAETAEAHQFGKAMSALASQPPEVVAQYAPQIFAKHPKYAARFAENGIPMDNPQVAVKMLAQQYGDYDPQAIEKNRAAIEASKASTASSYASTAATKAQAQQLSRQTPEWRQANAQRYGIDINTPEGKAFVISGQYTPKSDIVNVKKDETPVQVSRGPDGNVVYKPIDVGREPGITDPKDRASVEHQLRGEISGITKDYRTVREALGSLDAIAQQDSAGSDIALIFSYMKILDPNSVVRETEFATAQNAAGVPDQVRNAFNRLLNGERLNPTQRNDFLSVARRIGTQQAGQYQRTIDQYRNVAERTKVDPRNVILDQDLLSPNGGIAQGNSRVGNQAPPPRTNAIDDAKAAIAKGAPREKVIERLRQNGIPVDGL